MQKTQWMLVIFVRHRHKSDTMHPPCMQSHPWLQQVMSTSGHICVDVLAVVHSMVDYGHN